MKQKKTIAQRMMPRRTVVADQFNQKAVLVEDIVPYPVQKMAPMKQLQNVDPDQLKLF